MGRAGNATWDTGSTVRSAPPLMCPKMPMRTIDLTAPGGSVFSVTDKQMTSIATRLSCLLAGIWTHRANDGNACMGSSERVMPAEKLSSPKHACLPSRPSGSEWVCDRGYVASGDACIVSVVPDNACLKPTQFGRPWAASVGIVRKRVDATPS